MVSQLPQCGEASVTLAIVNPQMPCVFPRRTISLTQENPTVQIGRTSKRNIRFEAASTNCWFDSPVMSRNHAQLRLDPEEQKLYITDASSLHGTSLNGSSLVPNESHIVHDGDIVRFGMPIERGRETFHPYAMKVSVQFDSARPANKPVVFRVPDDSDIEDVSGDEDPAIQHSAKLLQQHNIRPARSPQHNTAISIDLTGHEDPKISDSGDQQQNTSTGPQIVSLTKPSVSIHTLHVDLTQHDDDRASDTGDVIYESTRVHSNSFVRETDDSMDVAIDSSDVFHERGEADLRLTETTDSEIDSMSDFGSSVSDSSLNKDEGSSNEISTPLFAAEDELDEQSEFADGESISCSEHDSIHEDDEAWDFREPPINNGLTTGAPPTLATPESDDHIQVTAPRTEEASVDQVQETTVAPEDLWTSPLPPMRSQTHNLPEISQAANQSPHGSLRLPPIFAAIPRPRHSQLGESMYYQSTGELMGAKTGKFEYFYAREQNKALAQTSSTSLGPDAAPASWATSINNSEMENSSSHDIVSQDTPDVSQDNLSDSHSIEHLSTNTAEVPGPWSTSGEKFLSSPLPANDSSVNQVCNDVSLDETSAYQYEVSKKAAHANTQAKESFMTINNLVDPPSNLVEKCPPQPENRSLKRKVDEISELTPEERAEEAEQLAVVEGQDGQAPKELPSAVNATLQQGNPTSPDQDMIVLERDITRPAKRIHRAAEVVCYAALGGAFVMSALIATAPTF